MPVYNGAAYVGEAIESVLCQSFPEWELIVQDDCSTDGSESVVKQYKDPRIVFARNSYRIHIAGTLNAALHQARGKYIQLLGQDDHLLPNYLAVQFRYMEDHSQVGFSFCAPYVIDIAGRRLLNASYAWDRQYNDTDEVCQSNVAMLLLFNYGCLPGNISTVMIHRESLEEVGGFNTRYRICLDWELWIKLAQNSGFGFIKERLVEIRSHREQESQNPNRLKDRIKESYECLDLLQRFLPAKMDRALRFGRKGRYGEEFLHQTLRVFLAGRIREGINLLGIIYTNDGILLPFTFWLARFPKRIIRRALQKGSFEVRSAFDSKWLRKQIESFRSKG